jgi:alcohol dehydrogenase (cytochrome c)
MAACLFLCPLLGIAQSTGNEPGSSINVTRQELETTGIKNNWLSYNGDYTGRRYSSLTEITPANVAQIRLQWIFHSRNAGVLEVTPGVVGGIMYVTASNDVYAIDSRNGTVLWHHTRPVTQGLVDDASGHINRGVAVLGNRLFVETDNAHLVCLDARSGNQLWDVADAPGNRNYGATSAPLIVKGKVIVGTSGGDDGVRGFVAAFDPVTGKELWRFWTIPGPGENGSSSWPGDMYMHGGGTTWMPGTYDAELNTIYWGTSNPSPDYDGSVRPGDDLYTDSLLALDPDTGKLKWYFQFTPHDLYDYDATETPVLVDASWNGAPRKLIVQANRNGFLYILDRKTGKFLRATQFDPKVNWAMRIDESGRPVRSGLIPTKEGTRICPGDAGATNWYSPTYNEKTHLFYFMNLAECTVYTTKTEPFEEGREYYSTGTKHVPGEESQSILLAYDPMKDSFPWKVAQIGTNHAYTGVMSTASGLLVFGDAAQSIDAADARTGKLLWHFNMGQTPHSSPMSYAIEGKQYFVITAGDDLFAFGLP